MNYTERVAANLEGMSAVSTGACPGCEECRDLLAPDTPMEEFEELWSSGVAHDEGGFSGSGCGICGNPLGNTLYSWHWIDSDGALCHESDACTDCVHYLANGDIPQEEVTQ